jgi:hypothetical protein
MIANRVALIVFVTASEEFDESTAAAQYFLHMAAQTGIPIVAWNADNAGFTFSKVMISLYININPFKSNGKIFVNDNFLRVNFV